MGFNRLKSTVKYILGFLILIGLSSLLSKQLVRADIDIEIDRSYTVSTEGTMSVEETELLKNNYSNVYVPAGSERKYYFTLSTQDASRRKEVLAKIYSTLKLTIGGAPVSYTQFDADATGQTGIAYKLPNRIGPNSSQKITVSYIHPELAEKNGGLLDAYIPAFADNFSFSANNTNLTYHTKLYMPTDSGQENIVSVKPISKFAEGTQTVYVFDQQSLVGNFVWVQRGDKQVYKFAISQKLPATTSVANGSKNEYRVIIPRDIDELSVNQKVYFSEISPEPKSIEQDEDGNLIGVFVVSANQDVSVVISGYAVLTSKGIVGLEDSGKIADYKNLSQDLILRNTAPAQYWEVDAPEIKSSVIKNVGSEDDVYKVVKTLYTSVIDTIDYSHVKRFGLNERQGALKTLQGGAAVCMEYSDLFLTELRADKVPARAVFGYGYDSRLASTEQEAHQWVQVLLPKQNKWISVDVTWGESGPEVIGGDLNHFYTHTASADPNTPAVLSRLSLGRVESDTLEGPKFEISTLADLPRETNAFLTTEALQKKYPTSTSSKITFVVDTFPDRVKSNFQLLYTNPGAIDITGWGVIVFSISMLIFVILLMVKMIGIINKARANSPKYKLYAEQPGYSG
jgi:transglutaminase-like putative cysteine protease